MDDDPHVIDNGWDALPEYTDKSGDGDDDVTVSISTTPGEWLVNTVDSVVVPMSMAEVVDAMRAHKLTERSLVWRQGMQEWACIEAVPQLKLAARLAPTRPAPPEAPSALPARPTPTPRATPLPQAGPSRRSTLPFGFAAPPGSRPAHAKPTLPPARSADEPGVLAVYERPAATISFDLSPEQPLRAPPPEQPARGTAPKIIPQQPVTLAPTTSDSASRSAPRPHRSADLSVVLAADFRAVKRTGKRLVLAWSLASAAAASLLTFWLSRSEGGGAAAGAARPPAGVALAASAPVAAAPPAPVVAPAPVQSATPVQPVASTPPEKVTPPRPKARPVSRRVKPPQPVHTDPSAAEAPSTGNTKDPGSEPNPYDVKLDDEVPATKPAPAEGSSSDGAPSSDPAAEGSSKAPGF